jgi:iron(III) transport system ATP-binding protein
VAPDEGTIVVGGRVISGPGMAVPPERRNMSMIFQSYALWPHLTIFENVAYGLRVKGLAAAAVAREVETILGVIQMRHLAERYPAELSGGQQQRVALARALVVNPETLLLDEPLSNLDANLREEMRFEIRRLHDRLRITTVYVTHDQAEAMVTSDRIVVMNRGRIEQIDDPFTLYNRPRTRFVAGFIGRTNFLEGRLEGDEIGFGGFSAPVGLFPDRAAFRRDVLFSVRPQSIAMSRAPGADGNGLWRIEGRIAERAYLGEHWDYLVRPAGGDAAIRVSAPPGEIFDTGETVWLRIDPRAVAHIADA